MLLPEFLLPDAAVRRACAVKLFNTCHVAPSHRRQPHGAWTDAVTLVCDLLLGSGAGRYLWCLEYPFFTQTVELRGFSAGSFAGLCLLQILWMFPDVLTKSKLGAIACPPALLKAPPVGEHELHLIHNEGDSLCNWKPGSQLLNACCTRYTYVKNENSAYAEHFGPSDHSYSHWLGLFLPHGRFDLGQFLFLCPEAAAGAKRDATPLTLISWLRFHLDPEVQNLIDSAMSRV